MDMSLQYDGRVLFVHVCLSRPPDVAGGLFEAISKACRGPELHASVCWLERFDREDAKHVGYEVKKIADASTHDDVFVFHVCVNTDEGTEVIAGRVNGEPGVLPASIVVEAFTGDEAREAWITIEQMAAKAPVSATLKPELKPDLKILRMLTCGTHGRRKWNGHVMCSNCGRVFQTANANKPRFAPFECKCGAQLMPDEEDRVGDALGMFNKEGTTAISTDGTKADLQLLPYEQGNSAARAICDHCFRKIDKRFNGKVPNYEAAIQKKRAEAGPVKN